MKTCQQADMRHMKKTKAGSQEKYEKSTACMQDMQTHPKAGRQTGQT